MSVVIVVKVSEGLVLAADSAATLTGRILQPDGVTQDAVLQIFNNAKKLLQIGSDFPIGVLTWGQAFIGPRTIESLVSEWQYTEGWESIESFRKRFPDKKYTVENCAKDLHRHLAVKHKEEFGSLPPNEQPGLGIVVAGYSELGFFPEVWRFVLPYDVIITNSRPDIDGKPDFGASWFGIVEPIIRLHYGRDERAIGIISEKYNIPVAELNEILAPLQYQIPFAQMPLQDAIDYANYMINLVIGRFRFVIGPELCGGKVDLAAITQREFTWISRKTWSLDK
jgi:hypothetical protein